MRVISGRFKGRVLDSPNKHGTHPMSEKMRGAMQNTLGDVSKLKILDAFSGSGAVAIEFISRGAEHVTAIEADKTAYKTIVVNIENLKINIRIKAIRASVVGWSDNNIDYKFDIIVCDPPYDNLQLQSIIKLSKHLKSNGTFILSWPGNQDAPEINNLNMIQKSDFNDAQLIYYKQ